MSIRIGIIGCALLLFAAVSAAGDDYLAVKGGLVFSHHHNAVTLGGNDFGRPQLLPAVFPSPLWPAWKSGLAVLRI